MKRSGVLSLTAIGVLLAGTGIAGFLVGQPRTPGAVAAQAEPPPPSVIATEVRRGRLTSTEEYVCTAAPRYHQVLTGQAEGVVTRTPLDPGAVWAEGEVGLELSARPVIGLTTRFPLFRDLEPSMEGSDVGEVQQALVRLGRLAPSQVDGTFGPGLSAALTRLYADLGYRPVLTDPDANQQLRTAREELSQAESTGSAAERRQARTEYEQLRATVGPTLPVAETAWLLPGRNRWKPSGLAVGSRVADGHPARVESGRLLVTCPTSVADALETDGSAGGTRTVALQQDRERCTVDPEDIAVVEETGSAPAVSEDAGADPALGDQEASGAATGGQERSPEAAGVAVPIPRGCHPAAGEISLRISLTHSGGDGLIVPVTALWDHVSGETTVRRLLGTTTATVPVRVTGTLDGEAAVAPVSGQLAAGDRVVVGRSS